MCCETTADCRRPPADAWSVDNPARVSYDAAMRSRLAVTVLLGIVGALLARDNHHPFRDLPALAVAVDSEFLLPRVGWFRYVPEAGHTIWNIGACNFRTRTWRELTDCPVAEVQSLGRNRTTLYAGGRGLGACDLASREWQTIPAFDGIQVDVVWASDTVLWVGTRYDGLSRYDLRSQQLRSWTSADGLPADNVSSIYVLPDRILAGVWRFGKWQRWPERESDWIGLGLYEVPGSNGSVRRVRLPPMPSEREREIGRQWLVTGIFPVPGDTDRLQLLLWHPWDTWCAEYEPATGECRLVSDAKFLVDQVPAIARCRARPDSCALLDGPVLLTPPPGIGSHQYPHNRLDWLRTRLTPAWAYRRLWGWRMLTEQDPSLLRMWHVRLEP